MVKVKICGITSVEDARAAVEAGADWIGLNFAPVSKRRISPARAAEIVAAVNGRVQVVGVFVNPSRREVEELTAELGLHLVQLHGDETAEEWLDFPVPLIKAVRLAPDRPPQWQGFPAAYVLADRYVPGEYGGTGQALPLDKVRAYRWPLPLIWAGGLNPENVAEVVRALDPYGVDVASGVERRIGEKDPEKMRRFVEHAKAA